MSHINVTINGRQYRMACEPGQETRLLKLADNLEVRVESLRGKFGEIGDGRLTVMAALMVADELVDAQARIRALEEELNALRDVRVVASDRARATQSAVAAALNAAADRIEKTTQVLNRTIGGGIAMG
ncbi:MAG: cell division protein ZapA [Tardiphaga sp.]|nr:cell division protein ZapA [Tardiphaga sp.]